MRSISIIAFFLNALVILPAGAEVATVDPVREDHCNIVVPGQCGDRDAIVFVHGIYAGNTTFLNLASHFDWPSEMPRLINGRSVDVFKLVYSTELLAWAAGTNPSFVQLAEAVMTAMKPLRLAGYRSIGFIAHSLGGNVVSTYVHSVKTSLGHPHRSQNAFIITLG
jgi:hypothetical protein